MNKKPFAALIALVLLSSTAFAADQVPASAVRTRAQVVDEIIQARAAGQLPVAEGTYDFVAPAAQRRAAAVQPQVRAAQPGVAPVQSNAGETGAQARIVRDAAAGKVRSQLPVVPADYDFASAISRSREAAVPGKTRAEVVAELRQSLSDGTYVESGEAGPAATVILAGTPRSRSQVRGEAIHSAQSSRSTAGIAAVN